MAFVITACDGDLDSYWRSRDGLSSPPDQMLEDRLEPVLEYVEEESRTHLRARLGNRAHVNIDDLWMRGAHAVLVNEEDCVGNHDGNREGCHNSR